MAESGIPVEGEALERLLRDSVVLLYSVRNSLADLLADLHFGVGVKEVAPKTAELEVALRRVFETEQKFKDWQNKQDGTTEEEIDYDALRFELGCRLARLAECCAEE